MIAVIEQRETDENKERTVYVKESEVREVTVWRTTEDGITCLVLSGFNDLHVETVDEVEAKRLYATLTSKGGLLEGV